MRDFGLKAYQASQRGQLVHRIIADREVIRDMVAFSRHNIAPAVDVIGPQIAALGAAKDDRVDRQQIGRWIAEILEKEGFVPYRNARVRPGRFFKTGKVFREKPKPSTP